MMFHQLDGFARILVSGPQRSGTRICAKIIAAELNMRFVDEKEFGNDDRTQLARIIARAEGPIVIHCPALMHVIHEYADFDACIVVMQRHPEEIRKSMRRIQWNYESYEKEKYAKVWHNGVSIAVEDIVDLKYHIWDVRQKDLIPNFQEIEYESLQVSPRWVPPEERQHFGPQQTD